MGKIGQRSGEAWTEMWGLGVASKVSSCRSLAAMRTTVMQLKTDEDVKNFCSDLRAEEVGEGMC